MNDDCSCDYDDYDRAEFQSVTTHKARKQHKCCECSGAIEPGDLFESIVGKWAGEFQSFKTCLRCVEARRFYAENNCGCQPAIGDLCDALYERAGNLPIGKGIRFRAYRLARRIHGKPLLGRRGHLVAALAYRLANKEKAA